MKNGRANGVEGLRILIAPQFAPASPTSRDSGHRSALHGHRRKRGFRQSPRPRCSEIAGHISLPMPASNISIRGERHPRGQHALEKSKPAALVNSAGLFADEVAALLGSKMAQHRIYPVRGEYCELIREKQDLVRGLVYPLPHADGLSLGVHLTKTLWGSVLVGPTARYISDKNDYERDREPIEYFANLAKKLLPSVTPSDFVPAYSGIRAKLVPPPGSSERRMKLLEWLTSSFSRIPIFRAQFT